MPVVSQTQEWTASLHDHKLKVHGNLTFPTPGYKVSLKKKQPQGINPEILLLDKTVIGPTGIEPDHTTTVEVLFEDHTAVPIKEIEIFPDGTTIKVSDRS